MFYLFLQLNQKWCLTFNCVLSSNGKFIKDSDLLIQFKIFSFIKLQDVVYSCTQPKWLNTPLFCEHNNPSFVIFTYFCGHSNILPIGIKLSLVSTINSKWLSCVCSNNIYMAIKTSEIWSSSVKKLLPYSIFHLIISILYKKMNISIY